MKKIILAVTALTLSAGAFASIDTNHKARSINAGVYASQEQAYAAGFKKIEQLQALPSNKLADELSVWQNSVVPKSVKIDGTEVVVQSFAKQPGVVEYRSIVKVDYQYKTRESNRD
ncbi:DUF3316 domain-containing protein [Vibrio cholerae]|uniref:DUF3316 domain-containing protein n=1 Tax=Vibrio cholerae TaxID=666 RepID=UPI0002C15FC4|nr:DUF3316 domain-containing protein [Vibrio cholerae]EMQ54690.1 hypothetical protein VCEM1676A_000892 [Vibrio cholerae O1 str. EM-1676A]